MRKRIRELVEQSTTYSYGGLGTEIEVFDKEKFAELIVQECIDYCGENLSKTVGSALKIHFGVEE